MIVAGESLFTKTLATIMEQLLKVSSLHDADTMRLEHENENLRALLRDADTAIVPATADPKATLRVVSEIAAERGRQERKFGQQSCPVGIFPDVYTQDEEYRCKFICEQSALGGRHTWAEILAEEVAELMNAKTVTAQREEAIQVAAVCAALVEAIDRGNA